MVHPVRVVTHHCLTDRLGIRGIEQLKWPRLRDLRTEVAYVRGKDLGGPIPFTEGRQQPRPDLSSSPSHEDSFHVAEAPVMK